MSEKGRVQELAPNKLIPLLHVIDISPIPNTPTTTISRRGDEDGFIPAPEKRITITPSYDRTVNRKLRGIHLFVGLSL
jgi:hypothetical protein